ncbi:armadillo repeat-containing protein 3-like isoform X2 [Gigantopelta aegis]|uniref:armadillo repeat-containing protein 3-like isoform X2 n=1 Tax=Gigantopelta aegis TaxID=1735272 RepID=UPI001B88A134|nr:armadillo repeat-containing protein 3-like isoform X2 [Gigantopelta aegis]
MGKKIKEDKKAPPDDVFDPLLVESRQAATVVLMLHSPEEDVQAKACEAIYKFVDKSDVNKKVLLDLDAVDPLLKLMSCEDRIVRRNSCMCLGIMCASPDVRKLLRKREESIPTFVNLLQPEEETVVHEFSALALSYFAKEFTSKVAIFEHGGVEALVRCLSSTDPDVQKNSIEALAQMLLEYQTRGAIRECEGLGPMLQLLASEYSIIQKLALLALDRASQDGENRARLRELETVTRLLEILARPELNDLHVMVVMVLSNLLEDIESLDQMKESGGLKKLVALITDQTPPEEETKKSDKKGGSRAGKKSAKGSAKKHEEKEEVPQGEQVIPTLPDVKKFAAKAIGRSGRNVENRKILHEQECEKMLIILLSHEAEEVQCAAAEAIAIMCENLASRDSIREWDGFAPLIKMLNSENEDLKEAATLALANLTCSNSTNCQEVMNLNGVEPLINILSGQREEAVGNAASALTNMAPDEVIRTEALAKGIVTALIDPLKSGNTFVQSKAALAVSAFVCDSNSRTEFRLGGGAEPLVTLLHSGKDEIRRNAAWAINMCAVDPATATEMTKLGALEILMEIQLSSTRRSPFTDAALNKLLDSNLAAKYAMGGHLDVGNLIEDGFIDAGQLRPGQMFRSLEDYLEEEMNDKRAVLLVNAKPEQAPQPRQEEGDGTKAEGSKAAAAGKSRAARDSKQKTKAQKEKEEKQREEELQAQLAKEAEAADDKFKPFSDLGDPTLCSFIDDITEKILPLPTTMEQIVALAEFVSEKMGGSIEKGQVANFSWELPLSQIKFELKSNVIPIGKIRTGIYIHRALLFKTLADRIAIGCTLTRGEYNHAWNQMMIADEDSSPELPKFPPKTYIVDLMHEPGRLLPVDAPEAITYTHI